MNAQPLKGRRVVELGTMVAAPFATHILAQLGAEVIKVEPLSGDTTRSLVRGGPSGTFIAYNHGKKSLCLDLTAPEGREALARLMRTADVAIHNLSPSAARKLGVTTQDLAAINPALICCHIRGYGPGPQQDDLATNPVAEAATGVMEDHRIDGRPSRLGPSYHDQFAGAYAVIHVLSSLLAKAQADGEAPVAGGGVEIGLYETGLHLAGRDLAGLQLKTQLLGRPEREAGGEFAMPGYGAYQSADGRWVYLLVLTDVHWRRLTGALDMPEGGDAALATLRGRKKQRERVEEAVSRALGALDYDAAAARLREGGVGFTEVMPLERVLETPQARQPGKLRSTTFGGLDFEVPEFPGREETLSGSPPPRLGEHSVELLRSLGYEGAECAMLLDRRVIAAPDPDAPAWTPPRDNG